ncbi:MAG: TldD/PmbA family protein [Bacilli bacterium]|nr:TldD/PmbA family protein [Bacilli bacterium]
MYSQYLTSRHDVCKELVERLSKRFPYVSLLGKHVVGKTIQVTTVATKVTDTMEAQCGFVVKLYNGKTYAEYSFSEITPESIDSLEKQIIEEVSFPDEILDNHVHLDAIPDEPLKQSFVRSVEGKDYSVEEIIAKLGEIRAKIQSFDPRIVQAITVFTSYETSAMFLSKNRDLTQNFTWPSVVIIAVARSEDGNVQMNRDVATYNSYEKCFEVAEEKIPAMCQTAIDLLSAEMIVPGVYDIITEPSITGLIAHEAFGHGVEMDMFVKNRAKSVRYLNKRVASDLVEMHDGAAATLSAASYFFDDDGVLAHDTLIIDKGILQTGISDAVSAMQLGTVPTGNGRRESYKRKAYTRMTNTFFKPGTSTPEEMISSVKHGYLLSQTDNGMEDPKNWNIQCVCAYGREIKDGKLTGKIVAPVVMSGYVPDLLESISMVSSTGEVIGSGHCGKGYKEWVPVSDGGPYLKARCKLS